MCMTLFVRLECIQPLTLINALGLVREQHSIPIEGNAYFMRMAVVHTLVRIHRRGRIARQQRAAYIVFIGR